MKENNVKKSNIKESDVKRSDVKESYVEKSNMEKNTWKIMWKENDVEERDIFDEIKANDNEISNPVAENPQPKHCQKKC